MKRKAGILTCSKFSSLIEEDVLLLGDLRDNNIDAVPVIWDNKNYDLKTFDLIIVRTVWDYFYRYREFSDWMDFAESEKLNVVNDISIIRENINKFYLEKLREKGVNIIPSLFYEKSAAPDVDFLFDELESDTIILKPVIAGGAFNLFKADRSSKKESVNEIINKINDKGFIVQKYMDEIKTEGEISLVFFDNDYSHSVRKMPPEGDFRVQGGKDEYFDSSAELIEKARDVLQKLNENTLYARIDCLYFGKKFYLVEAELFEPQLFTKKEKYRKNFINAILKRLK